MPDYFLLLKLIMTLNDDTADNSIAGQDKFIMDLSEADVAALSDQLEELGIAWRRLLERRKWREDNRQPELVIKNG